MKIITLEAAHHTGDDFYYVNFELVRYVRALSDYTKICFSEEHSISVAESPEEIMRLLLLPSH